MKITQGDDRLSCVLAGSIDTFKSQELEAALKSALEAVQPVSFDMQDVTYVCSAFLRVCIFVAKKVGRDNFRITGLTPPIKRVFMMAGIGDFFQSE